MESPYLASNDQPALGVFLNVANTPIEKEDSATSLSIVEEVGMGALLGVDTAPAPPPKSTGAGLIKKWLLDRVLVSMYVPPLKRVHPMKDKVALDLEDMLNCLPLEPPQLGGFCGYTHARPLSELLLDAHDNPLRAVFHPATCLYG